MKRVFGGLMVLMGIILGCWVGYNLVIQRQPEAEGMSFVPPLLFCAGLLYVGLKWARD